MDKNKYPDVSSKFDKIDSDIQHILKMLEIEKKNNEQMYDITKSLYEALKTLVEKYWCNRGSDGKTCPHPKEFIACITPNDIPDYWRKAGEALDKYEGK